jgi:hypothetical protein
MTDLDLILIAEAFWSDPRVLNLAKFLALK